jgi:hypothetical protein
MSSMTERVIERRMPAVFRADGQVAGQVLFRWEPSDPAAVAITFGSGGPAPVQFFVARNLLAAGLSVFSGDSEAGHVLVWPIPQLEAVCLSVLGDGGFVGVELPARRMEEFLAATYFALGLRDETYDVDGLIAQLLEGAQS